MFLALAKYTGFLVPILTDQEKHGKQDPELHHIPAPCAALALDQWLRLKEINDHRRALTHVYYEEFKQRGWPILKGIKPDMPLQKFPLFVLKAERIRKVLQRKNIHLHDGWTSCVVCPATVQVEEVAYMKGEDTVAEQVCEAILTLPTHPGTTVEQARELVKALEPFLNAA